MVRATTSTEIGINKTRELRRGALAGRTVALILSTVWLIVAAYPILYILMTSFRSQNGYLTGQPWLPPTHPTTSNFSAVVQAGFLHAFLNSAIVSVITVILMIAFALFLSYVIVRTRARVVKTIFNVFLVGLAVPIQAAIIPVYILIVRIGLYDTLMGMVLPMVAFGLPLTVLIFTNFVRDIPNELYEGFS
ncbi:carbohydrate ABC transporter permease [Sulfobacillus harzensis]|uniref:Carbohydrate ABC transporter permease n=1 Tax=Sulfobacillus harzensis TaxID=2729629 RepID=A0A7Y0Q4R5_9FIRM|nr:carbohydrate ABC transporter permease [Sulfobacillus harzensis]NMP24887.1 carbohydrate ABC transporter permease [Sulfobacillus harzensis]